MSVFHLFQLLCNAHYLPIIITLPSSVHRLRKLILRRAQHAPRLSFWNILLMILRIERALVSQLIVNSTHSELSRYILRLVLVEIASEWINADLPVAKFLVEWTRRMIDLVNLLPIVDLRQEILTWSISHEMFVLLLEPLTLFQVVQVGDFLLLRAEIWFHLMLSRDRLIEIESQQISENIIVESLNFAILNRIVEFHLFRAPALVVLEVRPVGILKVRHGRVELILVEREELAIGDDRLRCERISHVLIARETVEKCLRVKPCEARQDSLSVQRLVVINSAIV